MNEDALKNELTLHIYTQKITDISRYAFIGSYSQIDITINLFGTFPENISKYGKAFLNG